MKRRDFLKSTAAVYGGSLVSGLGLDKLSAQNTASHEAVPGPRPNILFIMVDELRYPTFFPDGVKGPAQFLKRFMPNVHRLWKHGVKFGNYHTAANACTPSRGVMITGLYSQQSWLLSTILAPPTITPITRAQPVLNPAFPTYGRLLRKIGYETPYRGKWHVSLPVAPPKGTALERYGFSFDTYPDPTGYNFQGTYGEETLFHSDAYTAGQAIEYLNNVKDQNTPFCLTVSLVNPHDREFFPAGTEFKTVQDVFKSDTANPTHLKQNTVYSDPNDPESSGPTICWDQDHLKSPRPYGYAELPPNWETVDDWKKRRKPSTQKFFKELSELVWGGISEDSTQDDFTVESYHDLNDLGTAKAPYHYWRRGMDSYTQIMEIVDRQIGRVLDALHECPKHITENTIIVFASDHGEYSGAHGLPQGKVGTLYEEAWHIPLIVFDPSGRYTGDIDDIRMGLTSSVDLMPMLVSLGDLGTTRWMGPYLRKIYGGRHDMVAMLKSKDAPGRSYVLHATDEIPPGYFNVEHAPTHVLGLRTDEYKFGVYSDWKPKSSDIDLSTRELEFYDYSTESGRLELDSTTHDPRARATLHALIHDIIPNELQQQLPPPLRAEQLGSKVAHLVYRELIAMEDDTTWEQGGLRTILGYGAEF